MPDTTIIAPSTDAPRDPLPATESTLLRVSVRAWLTFLVIATVCAICVLDCANRYRIGQDIAIIEPLYSLSLIMAGFFFGQKNK